MGFWYVCVWGGGGGGGVGGVAGVMRFWHVRGLEGWYFGMSGG